MPVFYQFRKWKAFKVWRDNVSAKKVHEAKRILEENLFCLNPVSWRHATPPALSVAVHSVNESLVVMRYALSGHRLVMERRHCFCLSKGSENRTHHPHGAPGGAQVGSIGDIPGCLATG